MAAAGGVAAGRGLHPAGPPLWEGALRLPLESPVGRGCGADAGGDPDPETGPGPGPRSGGAKCLGSVARVPPLGLGLLAPPPGFVLTGNLLLEGRGAHGPARGVRVPGAVWDSASGR